MRSGVTLYDISVTVHVLAAIVAFGPTFAFPIIQLTAERAFPRSLPFALDLLDKITRRLVYPVGLIVGLTGVYQIIDRGWELGGGSWLEPAIVLYVLLFAIGMGLLDPRLRRAHAEAERMVERAGPTGEVALSDEYKRLIGLPNMLGGLLTLMVIVIVFLMVAKPF